MFFIMIIYHMYGLFVQHLKFSRFIRKLNTELYGIGLQVRFFISFNWWDNFHLLIDIVFHNAMLLQCLHILYK